MKALLFGATGMVGGEVLRLSLDDDRITRVISVGRRASGVEHQKLSEIIHTDYEDYTAIEEELTAADFCFFCIGVYQNDVPADVFWRITCDYQDALVSVLEKVAPNVTFCLFGAQGAKPDESSWFRFANAKGRAERLLFTSKLKKKYVFRPGYIHPSREMSSKKLSYQFMGPVFRLFPGIGITAKELAYVMLRIGIEGGKKTVFENGEMRDLLRDWAP